MSVTVWAVLFGAVLLLEVIAAIRGWGTLTHYIRAYFGFAKNDKVKLKYGVRRVFFYVIWVWFFGHIVWGWWP